jgi:hypothetical protein
LLYLSQPLAAVINSCIEKGVFPDCLKVASVTPLHKGGDKNNPNNYIPISLLSTISKIIERHISNELNNYLNETSVLNEHQSGFRQYHSCQTALLRLVDSWLHAMDEGCVIGTVYVDFKKAFDLVDHNILLYKLKLYHFSEMAYKFFASYLSNRSQLVKANGVTSDTCHVISGVPQGSILGPLLFLLYVNDLPLQLQSDSDMYADDVTIHRKGQNIVTIQHQLQKDLDCANEWCKTNNMAINPNKTTCMTLGSHPKIKNLPDLALFVDNVKIIQVETQKLLGIHIDSHLNWKTHVDKTCAKLVSKLALFKRIQYYLTLDVKVLYYNAYVTPVFDYGCVVWQKASKCDMTRLSKLQRRFAKIIVRDDTNIDTSNMFKELNWLTFEDRCKYFTSIIVYKSLHNLTPSYIENMIRFVTNEKYNLRSTTNLDVAHGKPRSNFLKRSFHYSAMETWNEIPVSIRHSQTLFAFKNKLKKLFFSLS